MQIEVNEKAAAIGGSVYKAENYDLGDGFYHFEQEGILALWENNKLSGVFYTRLGKEPRKPVKDTPIARFS